MKKILVTGGNGFVGSNLVDRLVDLGNDVYVMDNLSSESSSKEYENPKATYHYADVQDIDFYFNDINFDIIFHLAAHGRIQPSFEYPVEWFWNNAMNTVIVLDYARKNGCKSFVYATTSSKNHGSHLITPYTFSKVVGEDAVRMYSDLYGMNTAMATFYNVYGPREPKIGEYATVVAKFLRQRLEDNEPVTVVGDGSQMRDFTYVKDIVEGLIKISEGQWKGDNFDLGRGKPISILDIAKMVVENEEDGIVFVPKRKGEGDYTKANCERTESMIGWKAKSDVKDWIEYQIKKII